MRTVCDWKPAVLMALAALGCGSVSDLPPVSNDTGPGKSLNDLAAENEKFMESLPLDLPLEVRSQIETSNQQFQNQVEMIEKAEALKRK